MEGMLGKTCRPVVMIMRWAFKVYSVLEGIWRIVARCR